MSVVEPPTVKINDGRDMNTERRLDESVGQKRSSVDEVRSVGGRGSVIGPDDLQPSRVVLINRDQLFQSGLVPAEANRARSAEQYRVIKQDLMRYRNAKAPEGTAARQFVMVTSAQPGDGKTFTSFNLALSMTTERDHDILLIDGDVAKRDISRNLGMGDAPGLLDALRDPKRKFASVIYPTSLARLHFLPAGIWSDDAAELLTSQRMQQFMTELGSRYANRMVVLDSSPALLVPDARVLAAMVGQIVLVVKAGATLQHDVAEAAAMVSGPAQRLTLVLNQMESNDFLDSVVGYRYGYGYGYGNYGKSSADGNSGGTTG